MSTALPWMARGGATRLPGLDLPNWRRVTLEVAYGCFRAATWTRREAETRAPCWVFIFNAAKPTLCGKTFGYTGCDGVARPGV
jgi:hypothetical protein